MTEDEYVECTLCHKKIEINEYCWEVEVRAGYIEPGIEGAFGEYFEPLEGEDISHICNDCTEKVQEQLSNMREEDKGILKVFE